MDDPNQIENDRYHANYIELKAVLKNHFSTDSNETLSSIIHFFIGAKETTQDEAWDINSEKENLRSNLRKAAEAIKKIHPAIMYEISSNLTLPLEVLNGTYNRKTCDKEIFELAPSQEKVDSIKQIYLGLLEHSEALDKAIWYTLNDLSEGIPIRNRNIEAWKIVEGAVVTCRTYPGYINVPKRLTFLKEWIPPDYFAVF